MFTLNGASATLALSVIALLVTLMFLFSPRETVRGFREFFDPAVFRNFFRSIFRFRPQFSLRTLLLVSAVLGPLIAVLLERYLSHGFPDSSVVALGGLYIAIIVAPLVCWFYVEAFGPGPRQRWKKHLTRWANRKKRRRKSPEKV